MRTYKKSTRIQKLVTGTSAVCVYLFLYLYYYTGVYEERAQSIICEPLIELCKYIHLCVVLCTLSPSARLFCLALRPTGFPPFSCTMRCDGKVVFFYFIK